MICRSCLRAFARPLRCELNSTIPPTRHFFSTPSGHPLKALSNPTPTPRQGGAAPTPSNTPHAANYSTSAAAQPHSTTTPVAAPETETSPKPKHGAKASMLVMSSIPAGTPLKGLNFVKGRSDPVAMEDAEYPAWLWEILKTQERAAEKGKEGDLFSKSKKQRRLAAKRLRKEQAAHPEMMVRKVPIYEQTVDLPAGDGTVEGAVEAEKAREALQKAMRVKRRATIKEANFLKAMG